MLAPVVLIAIYVGAFWYNVLVSVVVLVGTVEWLRMCRGSAETESRILWIAVGGSYLLAAGAGFVWLRLPYDTGHIAVFWLCAVVWSADTGAYCVGSLVGGPKLAPRISPNKTWAGLVGGVSAATIASVVAHTKFSVGPSVYSMILLGSVFGFVSQTGDLLQSFAKRRCGVKESGSIIPGHGGMLDRIDGLIMGALGLVLVRVMFPEVPGIW